MVYLNMFFQLTRAGRQAGTQVIVPVRPAETEGEGNAGIADTGRDRQIKLISLRLFLTYPGCAPNFGPWPDRVLPMREPVIQSLTIHSSDKSAKCSALNLTRPLLPIALRGRSRFHARPTPGNSTSMSCSKTSRSQLARSLDDSSKRIEELQPALRSAMEEKNREINRTAGGDRWNGVSSSWKR